MTLKRKATSTYVGKGNAEAELAVTQPVVSGRTWTVNYVSLC